MKKLLLLSLVFIGTPIMHAATIKFNNKTSYSLNTMVLSPGGTSVPLNVPTGESIIKINAA